MDALSITAAAACAAATLVAPPYRWFGYRPLETPRRAFLAVVAVVTFALWLATPHQWPSPVFYPAVAVGIWLAAGAVTGPRPVNHVDRLVGLAAAWWLAAVLAPGAGPMAPALMAAAAAMQAAILIYQHLTGKIIFQAMAALTGNTNLLGTFLAPCAFLAMASGRHEIMALSPLIVAGALLTRCRAALVGLVIGVAVSGFDVLALALLGLGAAGYLWIVWISRKFTPGAADGHSSGGWASAKTISHRSVFWRVAIAQIRRRWFAGCGLDGLKLFVAQRSADIGAPGTVFRKAHSDILQISTDAGLFGLALVAAAVGAIAGIGAGIDGYPAKMALAALAAQIGCGLFLHTLYLPLGQITFFLACGMILHGAPGAAEGAGALTAVTTVAAAGLVAWRTIGWRFMGDYYHGRFVFGTIGADGEAVADVGDIRRALAWVPGDSTARFNAAEASALTGSPFECQRHLWHAVSTYDGEIRLAPVLARLGHYIGRSFPVELDTAACKSALHLEPALDTAISEIARIKKGLTPERLSAMPQDVQRRVMLMTGFSGKEAQCQVASPE